MKKELVAVVLSGGAGSRFWPFQTSKVLFPFFGKSLFDYSVRDALPKEVTRLVIVASPETASFYQTISLSMPHCVVVQPKADGMAGAMLSAEHELHNVSMLVIIADDVFDSTLPTHVLETAVKGSSFGVLPGWHVLGYQNLGYLTLSHDRILGVVEKPGKGNEPSEYACISGQYIEDSSLFFETLHKTQSTNDDVYEQALSTLMKTHEFRIDRYEGLFATLKYPWHVLDVMKVLFQRIESHQDSSVLIKDHVTIEGDVWIGKNVKIYENTKIIGPCYIGDNTIIGNNCLIRESLIGRDCVIGFNTDITRSYIGDTCWFHSNYVGDSVLEGNISMGSGAVLANLRLDEGEIFSMVKKVRVSTSRNKLGAMIGKDVRIGVNVSVMPGVKIGANSHINSGMVIDRDIEADSFYRSQSVSNQIIKNTHTINPMVRDEFKKHI